VEVPLFDHGTVRVMQCFAALTAIYMLFSRVDGNIIQRWAEYEASWLDTWLNIIQLITQAGKAGNHLLL